MMSKEKKQKQAESSDYSKNDQKLGEILTMSQVTTVISKAEKNLSPYEKGQKADWVQWRR